VAAKLLEENSKHKKNLIDFKRNTFLANKLSGHSKSN